MSERALERYAGRGEPATCGKTEKIHEKITVELIRNDPGIGQHLASDRVEIAELLTAGHGRPALRAVVSGPLDADKQDYLLRDSRLCGVPYGMYDIHQLHRSLVLGGVKGEEELMIDPDRLHAVEQYVLAKYYLMTSVYRHRVRLITDAMIVRAIQLGIDEDGVDELRALYRYDGSPAFIENYRHWDDARFLATFGSESPPGPLSGELVRRLQQRRLLKQVFSGSIKDFLDPTARERLLSIDKPDYDEPRRQLERSIADEITRRMKQPVDPHFVIVHSYTIKSMRESSRNDEGSILVDKSPSPLPFEEESTLFASINEGLQEAYVGVYAPVEWPTPADKQRTRRDLERPVFDCLAKVAGPGNPGGE